MERIDERQTVCPYCGHDNSYSSNEEDLLREGTILDGKYLIGRVLGRGGFGVTYLGVDLRYGEKVAIKEYFPYGISMRQGNTKQVRVQSPITNSGRYKKGLEAFESEADNLFRFNSPSIVHVRNYFHENDTAYIVMDFLEGTGFGDEIERCGGKMSWIRVMDLMLPLMRELANLHKRGLLHRDIKPDNIRIVRDETYGEHLVLLDFGNARGYSLTDLMKTNTQTLTSGFAPYEQYMARAQLGPYTDVYSLCATMYTAIAGKKPSAATDRMIEDDLRSFSSYGVDVPLYVENAIFHGMARYYQDRTQNMEELIREFTDTSADPGEYYADDSENPKRSKKPYGGGSSNLMLWFLLLAGLMLVGAGLIVTNVVRNNNTQVTSTEGSPIRLDLKAGDIYKFGRYEQDETSGADEIEWQVLAVEDNRALLISKYGLETKAYNDKEVSITWENCTLREWLNGKFYKSAFTEEEKSRIAEVTVSNSDKPDLLDVNGTNVSNDTRDKIFLLSKTELEKYFANEDDRICAVTYHAKQNGADTGIEISFTNLSFETNPTPTPMGTHQASWWLRSPGWTWTSGAVVLSTGAVYSLNSVSTDDVVVRPVLWLELEPGE